MAQPPPPGKVSCFGWHPALYCLGCADHAARLLISYNPTEKNAIVCAE